MLTDVALGDLGFRAYPVVAHRLAERALPRFVRGGRAANRHHVARNARGCGSLAAMPLPARISTNGEAKSARRSPAVVASGRR